MASLLFYIFLPAPFGDSSIWSLLIMLGCIYCDFLLARPIYLYGKENPKARAALYFCAAKNILLFVAFSSLSQLGITRLPVGVGVYAFTSLGYLIDLYNGEAELALSPYEYGLFCCFFGKIYVGPIVSYNSFIGQLQKPRLLSFSRMSNSFSLVIHGLAKKIILADGTLALARQLQAITYEEKTVFSVWLLLICYIFATYFILSGYSDMARGTGGLLGLELPENFHYPLQADSVTDFFSRFNISANRFVRKYVYGALEAEDTGPLATSLNIILITLLMGLWYGISINFLVWGGWLGLIIVIETVFCESLLLRLPTLIRRLYSFVIVVLSFVWFSSQSLNQAFFYLQTMLGLDRPAYGLGVPSLAEEQSLYLASSNWLLLLLCVLFCTSLSSSTARRLGHYLPKSTRVVTTLCNLLLLGIVLAFMV